MSDEKCSNETIKEGLFSQLFGLAAIATGMAIGVALAWTGSTKLSQWWRADENIEVQATVLKTHIDIIRSTNNKTGAQEAKYEPLVVFEVPIDGKNFQAKKRLASCWDMDEAMALVDKYPDGAKVPVFCHPKSPETVFFDNDLPFAVPLLMSLFGVSLAAMCGFGGAVYIKSMIAGSPPPCSKDIAAQQEEAHDPA